jgi:long-chain acyl-CoA synthetase
MRRPGIKNPKQYLWLKSYPKQVKWDTKFSAVPVYKLLDDNQKKFPTHNCIDFLGKKYTYAQIADLANRAACGLQKLGVKKGTKVGLFMPNAPYYVIMYYAILKAGGVVVNYNPLYAPREIEHQVNDSKTEIMITLDLKLLCDKIELLLGKTSLKKMIVCPLKDALPFPKNILFPIVKFKEVAKVKKDKNHLFFNDIIQNNGRYRPIKLSLKEDPAVLQYTGGTTGVPKGATLTHANISINAQQSYAWFIGAEPGKEKILAALPLFHVFAMTAVMNVGFLLGAEIVMMFPRFNVEDAIKLIARHKITFFPAVPTIYTMINHHPKASKLDLSSLKICLSGGAALPLEVKRKFESITGGTLVEAYGLSETSPSATSNPAVGKSKTGSIGIPFPGTIIKIMSLEDPKKEVRQGEKGEICIHGPQVMKGYWNKPKETKNVLIDGLFHTGDVGYMDVDGYVFLVDRIKDMIVCSGYNVYPRNVEEAIYLHPSVEEVTVIGVPDPKRGETVKAFIKLKTGKTLDTDELGEFLKDKLSPIEIPKMVEFRSSLPKTVIGKLSKKELVEEELKKIKSQQ